MIRTLQCLFTAGILATLAGCSTPPPQKSSESRPTEAAPLFREVGDAVGLRFFHTSGAAGEFYMPEIMGSGVALLDYDNDGALDVFLAQGGVLTESTAAHALRVPLPDGFTPGCRLFRNELTSAGTLRFTDVTEKAGVRCPTYGMGAAVGDYDNDGFPDLYLTGFGHNVLLHNTGNGTFDEVTDRAGVRDSGWSTSASWVDYDNDGAVDLFVAHYVDFTLTHNTPCFSYEQERDYCSPHEFAPTSSRLFRNLGNGRFRDVSADAGITAPGPGLGVVGTDFNGDGRVDMFVANDGAANHLWLNQGAGKFKEAALSASIAYNIDGKAQANMGIAVGDANNDGTEHLFVTHLPREGAILYRQDGKGNFEDATTGAGLLLPTLNFTGFGTDWFDYDNDGWLDLFVANGSVHTLEAQRGTAYPFRERNQLFHNDGTGKRFRETTAEAGAALELSEVSRGAAFGDLDNDGDVDIIVSNNNGPARVLLNETGNRRHWVEVRLQGVTSNGMGLGARVALVRRDQKPLWRRSHTDGSYLSASDARVHFGLGDSANLEAIEVRWPDGKAERWEDVKADRVLTLRQGSGRPVTAR